MTDAPALAALRAMVTEAAATAYAPYSAFHVGAAVVLSDGTVITGANVENASYGLSLCAEAVALAKAANMGRLADVRAVAVAGGHKVDGEVRLTDAPLYPCGRCRQMMAEAAILAEGHAITVHALGHDRCDSQALATLLPHGFGASSFRPQ